MFKISKFCKYFEIFGHSEDFEYLIRLDDSIQIISASKYPTISHMHTRINRLINGEISKKKTDFKFLAILKDKLISSMNWRFDYILSNEHIFRLPF